MHQNYKKIKLLVYLATILGIIFLANRPVYALEEEISLVTEEESSFAMEADVYQVRILDEANLLTKKEEEKLQKIMKPVTKKGNALLVTTKIGGDIESKAKEYYWKNFGNNSGVLLYLDDNSKDIYIYGKGVAYRNFTKRKNMVIIHDVNQYAGAGDYYGFAAKGFHEITELVMGKKIRSSMVYICNACLALGFSFVICMIILSRYIKGQRIDIDLILSNTELKGDLEDIDFNFVYQKRISRK